VGLLNKSCSLAAALGVTKVTAIFVVNLVTTCRVASAGPAIDLLVFVRPRIFYNIGHCPKKGFMRASGAYHDLNIFFYFIVVKIVGEKNYSTIFSPSLKGLNFWFHGPHCKKISWEPEAFKVK
jgi:hypothetical protein